jgi:hypothetical protein
MVAPMGCFAMAQFRKVYDNPDLQLILADCWDSWEAENKYAANMEQLM